MGKHTAIAHGAPAPLPLCPPPPPSLTPPEGCHQLPQRCSSGSLSLTHSGVSHLEALPLVDFGHENNIAIFAVARPLHLLLEVRSQHLAHLGPEVAWVQQHVALQRHLEVHGSRVCALAATWGLMCSAAHGGAALYCAGNPAAPQLRLRPSRMSCSNSRC